METSIIDIFRKSRSPVTFWVIPYVGRRNKNDLSGSDSFGSKKWETLRAASEAGILEVALHGFSHRGNNTQELNEFSNLDYSSQLKRISMGKELLERVVEIPVNVFIPPWNQYDLNTLRVLEELKFSTISGSLSGIAPKDSRLKFLPATCHLLELRDVVKTARSFTDTQPIIVVLSHAYDFKEVKKDRGQITLKDLRSFPIFWTGSSLKKMFVSCRLPKQSQ